MATKTTKTTKTAKKTTSKRPTKNVATRAPRVVETAIPEAYTPIGMWGYFGYSFLFMLPVVGWILCIAFAFMAQNINLRNYARSQFCWIIIDIIIFCVLAGVGALATVFKAFGLI